MDVTSEPRVGKERIRELIPHAGSMCLLDQVMEWDDESILCLSRTHLDSSNPLRRNGRLSAIHAFEYGAQSVAVHGGLRAQAAGTIAPPGYFAALRDASLEVEYLDDLRYELVVWSRRLFSDKANSVYDCEIKAGEHPIARARITIILATSSQNADQNLPPRLSLSLEKNERVIPTDHPCLAGHFPDRPIVPAVVILDEVTSYLAEMRKIRRINYAKFLSPLRPEQVFTISLADASSTMPGMGFRCDVGDRVIAEGRLQ